jgi:hypothetical protein
MREMWYLQYENKALGWRGIFIWKVGYGIISKRANNDETNVVRFVSARLGTVVIKHVPYIRRVATILRQERS